MNHILSNSNYYPGGMYLPNRHESASEYRYGFNGMEKDDEIKGEGNSYDYGARMYNPRIMRWMSLDPLMVKYPHQSPYGFVGNSPLEFIDPNGKEWVNVHTAKVESLNKQLLDNPNSKKLQRQLKRAKSYETRVNNDIQKFKDSDIALYNYIDNLTISSVDGDGVETVRNIKVYVSSDIAIRGPNGEAASTSYTNSGDSSPNVNYGDKKINAPQSPNNPGFGFDVIIYGKTGLGDSRLANEVGDVMFRMEYSEDAIKGGSDAQFATPDGEIDYDGYMKTGNAGDYSDNVENEYIKRKKDGSGKDLNNNPYPLKNEK